MDWFDKFFENLMLAVVGLAGLGIIGLVVLLFKTSPLIGLVFIGFFSIVGLVTTIQIHKEKKEKERLKEKYKNEYGCESVSEWEE